MNGALSARDVLDDLNHDANTEPAFFPDFDHGYHYHVDARLTVYGDGTRWAITIEHLQVNPRAGGLGGIATHIYYHGPDVTLAPRPGWGDKRVQSILVVEDGPGGPLLQQHSSEEIDPAAKDLRVRGHVVSVRTDEGYYWARMIETSTLTHQQIDEIIETARQNLDPERAAELVEMYETQVRPSVGTFDLRTWHLMRGLVPEHRDLFLATEDERRRGLPADLPMLLQLGDWEHPRLLDGEMPSGSESFKQIARVIARADPTLYQPHEGNVHWRNWPNSGNL